jgi:hypothetical protein
MRIRGLDKRLVSLEWSSFCTVDNGRILLFGFEAGFPWGIAQAGEFRSSRLGGGGATIGGVARTG